MDKDTTNDTTLAMGSRDVLTEILRNGAHHLLAEAIENEVVRVGGGEIVMWDLIERLCAEKGLKLKDMGRKKLGIGRR